MKSLTLTMVVAASLTAGSAGARGVQPPVHHAGTPWEELVLPRCEQTLRDAGVRRFTMLRPHRIRPLRRRGDLVGRCHVPQRVRWRSGPAGITYTGYVVVNCRMALALGRFERVVQAVAASVFGKGRRVTRIRDLGSYSCRAIRGKPRLSEHAYGNALDVSAFVVRGYGTVSVRRHWASASRGGRFLRKLVAELHRQRVFSVILGPDYDRAHKNHLHFDLKHVRMGLSR